MPEFEAMDDQSKSNHEDSSTQSEPVGRRTFMGSLGLGAAGLAGLGSTVLSTGCSSARAGGFSTNARAQLALDLRRAAADAAFARGSSAHQSNGDEARYPDFIANFSKGLPHDALGQVEAPAYRALRFALDARDFDLLDRLNIGPRRLENPRAGTSFALEGSDPQALSMPPAPRFDSAEQAGEMVELYWMALLRDLPFADYAAHADVQSALTDLNALSDFRGPRSGGSVTPSTLFRCPAPGALAGPYLSQFLLVDAPLGTLNVSQRQETFLPGVDFATDFSEWHALQAGQQPTASIAVDGTPRHIRNLRDLAAYVQKDVLYQAYFNAALVLFSRGAPLRAGVDFYASSSSQAGFVNCGEPHLMALLANVSAHALRAVWAQKWLVHRRLRPEAFGGRVHVHRNNQAIYPLHADALNSAAVARTESRFGTALLPLAFPEGSPRHPSYGAGHNTVAAACASILKAFFEESAPMPNPVVPSADGTSLVPYTGPDANSLTVGGEIDKLAANIAQGRNAAGVHWRSDYTGSMPLGESVAEGLLRDQQYCLPEPVTFRFTRLDGTEAIIEPLA